MGIEVSHNQNILGDIEKLSEAGCLSRSCGSWWDVDIDDEKFCTIRVHFNCEMLRDGVVEVRGVSSSVVDVGVDECDQSSTTTG